MNGKILRRSTALATLAAALLAAGTVRAQTAPASSVRLGDDQPAEEIVVTATKRQQKLVDVPESVQVLDEKQLQQLGADSLTGFARQIAGLSIVDRGPGQTQLAIRGVSTGLQQDIGTDDTVGVYIDEIPVSVSQAEPDLKLFDLNRVEVLRGPQGTLYGSGSLGGTVRLITNQPAFDLWEERLEVTGSGTAHADGGNAGVNALVNAPLLGDKAAARLTIYDRANSGWVDDVERHADGVNDERTFGGRLSVRYEPITGLNLIATGIVQNSKFGELNVVDPALGDLKIARAVPETFTDHLQVYNLTGTYDFGWANVTSSTSYTERHYGFIRDFSGLFGRRAVTPIDYAARGFTQETRLASDSQPGQRYTWLVGAFYNNKTDGYAQVLGLDGSGPSYLGDNVIFRGASGIDVEQYAFFGEASYKILPKLTATAGLRYFHADETTGSINQTIGADPTVPHILQGTHEVISSKTTPKFSLSYMIDPRTQIYAQAAEGFRIGGVNRTIPPIAGQRPDPVSFGPDSLWNYEVGLKGDWFDHRFGFTVDAFDIEWKNIQIQLTDVGGNGYYANAGNARSHGAEAQTTLRPLRGLEFDLTGTWLDARERQAVPNLGARQGSPLPDAAHFSGSISGIYTRGFGDYTGFVRGDLTYTGKSDAGFNTLPQGDYALVNFRVGVSRGPYDVEAFLTNALDRRAVTLNFPFPYDSVYTLVPRTAGLTVRARF